MFFVESQKENTYFVLHDINYNWSCNVDKTDEKLEVFSEEERI